MENLEIKQEIERTIIAFFTEMNGWEIYCEDIDNNPDLSEKEKTELMKLKISSIFSQFCTSKDRKMGLPNCLSWGLEGSYKYDPSKETITDIERVTKNKFHVYTCIEKGLMKELHCYVCVCKSNKWLIDSKKRKWGDDTKWSNIYL